MKYNILDFNGNILNTIVASADFMQSQYPNGNYVAVPEASVVIPHWYTTLEFYRLFSISIRATILNHTDPLIKTFVDTLRVAGGCYLTDAETIQGIQYLMSVGIISENQSAQILNGVAI
jgi:hypothetical protein